MSSEFPVVDISRTLRGSSMVWASLLHPNSTDPECASPATTTEASPCINSQGRRALVTNSSTTSWVLVDQQTHIIHQCY